MNIDLNRLIPAFLAADDERRRRAMEVLTEADKDQEPDAGRSCPERLMNQTETAKMLGVHPTTLRRWRLPCRRFGRLPRYRWDEVMEYLSSQQFRHRLKELKQTRRG